MRDLKEYTLDSNKYISDALEIIDNSECHIAVIVNDEYKVLGTITDGDIRRGLLKGIPLNESVSKVMNTNPILGHVDDSANKIKNMMEKFTILHLPIINNEGNIVDLMLRKDFDQVADKDNTVVIMAGGLGSRLKELTKDCPKPLLPLGDKPLLEITITNLVEQGFRNIYLSVNYFSEMIKEYFGNGEKWNANIRYIDEEKRMGTAGSLGLLDDENKYPMLIINGDILTQVNYDQFLSFHIEHNSIATMSIRKYDIQVPYGVVKLNGSDIKQLDEKPEVGVFVNAGVYLLEKEVLDFIPENSFYDMTSLFNSLIEKKLKISAFPLREYWIDVGEIGDYNRAVDDFNRLFK